MYVLFVKYVFHNIAPSVSTLIHTNEIPIVGYTYTYLVASLVQSTNIAIPLACRSSQYSLVFDRLYKKASSSTQVYTPELAGL